MIFSFNFLKLQMEKSFCWQNKILKWTHGANFERNTAHSVFDGFLNLWCYTFTSRKKTELFTNKIGNCTAKCLRLILYLTFIQWNFLKNWSSRFYDFFFFWSTSCQSWISRVGVQAWVNISVVRTCALKEYLHWAKANTKAKTVLGHCCHLRRIAHDISLSLIVNGRLG